MTATDFSCISSDCVPVSSTETDTSNLETCVSALYEVPDHVMRRLIGVLVHQLGWTLGEDGNLYSPNPAATAWRERAN